jgi:ribose 5-phosphate isomerase B
MGLADRIAIGSDHAGFDVKQGIVELLKERGFEVQDAGPHSKDSVDYPDYAKTVAESVSQGNVPRGVLVCNSGIGMSIAANKVAGVRAALCMTPELAKFSRLHNDANVLCLSAAYTTATDLKDIVNTWLDTEFEGGRHERRVNKIKDLDK